MKRRARLDLSAGRDLDKKQASGFELGERPEKSQMVSKPAGKGTDGSTEGKSAWAPRRASARSTGHRKPSAASSPSKPDQEHRPSMGRSEADRRQPPAESTQPGEAQETPQAAASPRPAKPTARGSAASNPAREQQAPKISARSRQTRRRSPPSMAGRPQNKSKDVLSGTSHWRDTKKIVSVLATVALIAASIYLLKRPF